MVYINIAAQIIGFFAILSFAIAPQQKKKSKVLLFQLIASVLYGIQYFILGAYTAVATNIADMIKTIVFLKYSKDEKKIPIYYFIIYSIVIIVLGVFTINSFISSIPVIAALLFAYATWQSNLKVYRIINTLVIIMYAIYNLYFGAYVSCIGSTIQFVSAIIAIVRLDIINKKQQENLATKNI